MYTEATGRIVQQLEEKFGTTKSGKDWHKISFLLQLDEGSQFEHSVVFSMTSFDGNIQDPPKVQDVVKVGMRIIAHQFNGKWFNEVQAMKCERV